MEITFEKFFDFLKNLQKLIQLFFVIESRRLFL